MKKSKNTKRALLASVLSTTLCIAMLIGATFAWFTDTASTAVNKIQSGTLDVALVDAEGNSLEGKTLEWIKADSAAEGEEVLWEPGCTYKLQPVYVKNNGNLALKFKIVISGIVGDAKLLEAIDFTYGELDVNAEGHLTAEEISKAITIEGHMKEEAGNEYQNLSIEGIGITVYATQDTVESDSYDNKYDKDAEYPEVSSTEELRQAMTAENVKAVLTDNIEITGKELDLSAGQTVEIDLNGKTIGVPAGSTENICTFINNGGTLILKNGTIKNGDVTDDNYNSAAPNRNAAIESYGGVLIVENCTISNAAPSNGSYVIKIADDKNENGCVATFKNCNVSSTRGGINPCGHAKVIFEGGSIAADYYYPVYVRGDATAEFNGTRIIKNSQGGNFVMYVDIGETESGKVTFNNCTFEATVDGIKMVVSGGIGKERITLNDCTIGGSITNNLSE